MEVRVLNNTFTFKWEESEEIEEDNAILTVAKRQHSWVLMVLNLGEQEMRTDVSSEIGWTSECVRR